MPRESEQERQQRLKRMLAREQGAPLPEPEPAPAAPPGKAGGQGQGRAAQSAARPARRTEAAANTRPLSPLLRRRKRRRRLTLLVLAAAALLVLGSAAGVWGQAALALGDMADSAVLYFNRAGGGWPADTGITDPLRVEGLAGGLVLMDREDVAVYSAYGARVRTIQPGYARPCLAVNGTRFAVYNRAGTELRVESRTKTLYTYKTAGGILLCALAPNGDLALLTQDERYAAVLQVMDTGQRVRFTCSFAQDDGVPVALAFAPDGRRLASGAVTAQGGRMQSLVYLMDTSKAELGPCYRADAGSLVLALYWLGGSRVLAVFDTYAALLDTGAQELARYGYGGAVLQSVDATGRQAALLLTSRSSATLVTLGDGLKVLSSLPAEGAQAVTAGLTAVYLLRSGSVARYGYDGTLYGEQAFAAPPQAVIAGDRPLAVAEGIVQELAG